MKKLKLKALLLSATLTTNIFVTSMTVFSEEISEKSNCNIPIEFNDSIGISQKLKIDTYEDFSNMSAIGLNRGNYHGRQPLGFILPANVEFKIRQINTTLNKNLTLDLFNDDSNTEKSITIPKNGDWVTVSSNNLSVPFIRKISSEQIPEVEFVLKGKVDKLPIYREGMDENNFFKEWDDLDSNFAFIENNRVQMLVPKIDKNTLKNMNDFSSIDELFKFYNEMFNTYDRLLGLEKNSKNPLNNNVDTQYFVKADKHGAGAAYYSTNYTAQNSGSMSAYLGKGWLPLHEVGHGYEYNIKNKGIYLVDVFNNILAYTYQSTYLKNDEGWLFNGNRHGRDLSMKNVREHGSYDSAGYQDKLGMFIYLLDFISEDNFSEFNRLYREKNSVGDLKNKSAITIFNELLSEITGYNFREYFGAYKLKENSNIIEDEKYSKYKNVFILGDIITDETIANKIKNEYGLKSIYSLISTEDMLKSNVTIKNGDIDFKVPQDIISENTIIQLKDGDRILKELPLDNNTTAKLTNIKPGRYTLAIIDTKNSFNNYTFIKTIDVKSGHNVVNIESLNDLSPIQNILDQKIVFKGLGDKIFAELNINLSNNTVKLKTNSGQPHSYYSSEYAKIEIIDENNKVIFTKSYIGDKNENCSEKIISIKPGYKINIYHAESPARLDILDFNNQKLNYSLKKNNEFTITELGLDNKTLNLNNNLERLIELYAQNLKETLGDRVFDYDFYTNHRVLLKNLIDKLSPESKERIIDKYGDILFNKNNIVYIPDLNLKKELNKKLNQNLNSDLTKENLSSLKGELDLNNKNISDLTGIDNCINITNLQLENNKINNLLPLKNMSNLTELNLTKNEIKDVSPIANLTNLNKLILNYNNIKDISSLNNLTNLNTLLVEQQIIQGEETQSQGHRAKVNNLIKNLDGTNLTPTENESYTYDSQSNTINFNNINKTENKSYTFNQSSNIKNVVLNFSGTVTQNIIYNEIANIPDINLKAALNSKIDSTRASNQDIYVSELNSLTGELDLMNKNIENLTGLEHCIKITKLKLAHNKINDIGSLTNLTNLKILSLDDNKISDISALSKLTNLTELYLGWGRNSSNEIIDITPLTNLTNLTKLDLSNNKITDISPLSNLTKLNYLAIPRNKISDISPLSTLINLNTLWVDEQKIQGKEVTSIGSKATIDNIIKGVDGNFINISNGKGYIYDSSTNKIIFNNITSTGNKSYKFNQQVKVGKATANFSGNVTQNIIFEKDKIIDISDPNFKAMLNRNIHKTFLSTYDNSDITIKQLEDLTRIDTYNINEVKDITAIKYCKNLIEINMANQLIEDISPIKDLINLKTLNFQNNKITDISPLKNLSNLKRIDLDSQNIQGKEVKSTGNKAIVNNIIKGVNGEFIDIPSGEEYDYDSNTHQIIFNNINSNENKFYTFNQQIQIGQANGSFSGVVNQNIIYNPNEFNSNNIKTSNIPVVGQIGIWKDGNTNITDPNNPESGSSGENGEVVDPPNLSDINVTVPTSMTFNVVTNTTDSNPVFASADYTVTNNGSTNLTMQGTFTGADSGDVQLVDKNSVNPAKDSIVKLAISLNQADGKDVQNVTTPFIEEVKNGAQSAQVELGASASKTLKFDSTQQGMADVAKEASDGGTLDNKTLSTQGTLTLTFQTTQ